MGHAKKSTSPLCEAFIVGISSRTLFDTHLCDLTTYGVVVH